MNRLIRFLLIIALFPVISFAQNAPGIVNGLVGSLTEYSSYQQGTPVLGPSLFTDSGTNPFYNSKQLGTILYTTAITATKTTNATSVTCNTAACTNNKGTYTLVGGTATTGTVITVAFSAPVTAEIPHSGAAGSSYAVGDTVTITCSVTNAVATVATVASGAVVTLTVTTPGSGCTTATAVATTTSGSGTGLTVDVTANLPSIPVCTATQNGGAAFQGIGNSVATTGGFNITAGVTVAATTVVINYECKP